MLPETKLKLDELTQRLKDRGVVDIKFFTVRSEGLTAEKLAQDTIDVVEAYLDGRMHPAPPIGDSVMGHRYSRDDGKLVRC